MTKTKTPELTVKATKTQKTQKPYVTETELLPSLGLALLRLVQYVDHNEDLAKLLRSAAELLTMYGELHDLPNRSELKAVRTKFQKAVYLCGDDADVAVASVGLHILDAVLELYDARGVIRGVDSKDDAH